LPDTRRGVLKPRGGFSWVAWMTVRLRNLYRLLFSPPHPSARRNNRNLWRLISIWIEGLKDCRETQECRSEWKCVISRELWRGLHLNFLSVVAVVQYNGRNSVKSPVSGVSLAFLGRCYKLEECAKSSAHVSVCLCNQSGVGATIRLLR
jgi:hypothetical protein